ncbi:hypothetical protein JCM10450v2_002819 [Rhodotorula kratochvilovae]
MPALSSLLPLALLPAAVLAAPFAPEQRSALRLTGRALGAARGNLTLAEGIARDLSRFEKQVERVQLDEEKLKKAGENLKKRSTIVPLKNLITDYALMTHAGNINIGTPAQTLPVLFDTGSYDLVMPVKCTNGCPNGIFNMAASSSFTNLTTPSGTSYAGGAYSEGYVATDRVSIGPYSQDGQHFLAATENYSDADENFAGVLGLAPYGYSAVDGYSFFDNLVTSGKLQNNLFSTWFRDSSASSSEVVIDGVDSTRYSGAFTQVPVIPGAGNWLIQTEGYWYQGRPLDNTAGITLVDSGTTWTYIPRSAARALAGKFGGKLLESRPMTILGQDVEVDIWQISCRFPYVSGLGFRFKGQAGTAPLAASSFDNIGQIEFAADGTKTCYASFFGVDLQYGGQPASLLGLPFLQSFYTVWSYGASGEDLSLSFASAKLS